MQGTGYLQNARKVHFGQIWPKCAFFEVPNGCTLKKLCPNLIWIPPRFGTKITLFTRENHEQPPNLICIPPRASKSHRDSAQIRHKNHSNILIQFPPYLSDFACKFIFHSKCYQHRNFIGVPHRFECIQAKSGRGTAWKWICIPNNRFWAGLRPSLKTWVCSEFGKALSDMGWVPRNQSYSTICCLK